MHLPYSLFSRPSRLTRPRPLSLAPVDAPRNLSVAIAVKGDELTREDFAKIKSQFSRWIEGLEEAFEE
jgi:hypothetical protein